MEHDARERLRSDMEDRLRELRFRLRPREVLSDARDAALSRAEPIAESVIDGLSTRRTEAAAAASIVGLAGIGVAIGYAVRVTSGERAVIAAARRDLTDLAAREFDRRLREASSADAVRAS